MINTNASKWKHCKKILCIRADNIGDVIMCSPAISAIKIKFNCHITLLTSKSGSAITNHIPVIDETIAADVPWVKNASCVSDENIFSLVRTIKEKNFDGVIIFTVYSQSSLPAAFFAMLCNIPLRLAYCRENPYDLLTDWIPDKEPYKFIQHQVLRDLKLAEYVGASVNENYFSLTLSDFAKENLQEKLLLHGIDISQKYIILHPGVSEKKREFPPELWVETAKLLSGYFKVKLLITGIEKDKSLSENIQKQVRENMYDLTGKLSMEEFIALIRSAMLIVTVNTATVHIAAAFQTPQIVLYALTNIQHTPWKTHSRVVYFPVDENLKSRNEVVKFASEHLKIKTKNFPQPSEILKCGIEMLADISK